MALQKTRFGWLLAVLAVVTLAGTSAQAVKNTFWVEVMGEQSVQGYCDGDYPRWYYYPNTGWWNQWFYNGPYDPDRKKVISITLTVKPLSPTAGSIVRLAYNWSTPAWKPTVPPRPPLPPLDSAEEQAFIGRQTFYQANFVPADGLLIEREFEISDYNPEWVSIDVQGYNFLVDGVIVHECVPKDQPTQACCFDDGHCEDLMEDECKRKGGDPQGANTNCATTNCPQPQQACCLPDGTCVYTTPESCQDRGGTPQGPGTTCADVTCLGPPEACCFPDGACQNLSPAACVENGGSPQGPGTTCLGDGNNNGIDDICEEGPCEVCGPGSHWVDNCEGGQDTMTDHGAIVLVDLDLDCEPDVGLVLGPCASPENLLVVSRSFPRDDSLQYPGTRPIDGHLDVIDTEIVQMCLTDGAVTLRAGAGYGLRPSLGVIAEQPSDPTVADSFFDVYFEIDLGGGMYAYNHTPVRVDADITCIPPQASYMHPTGCIPLYSSPYPGAGTHIANLTRGQHDVYPDEFPRPEACCLPDGTCIDTLINDCLAKGGVPQGPWTTCANTICPEPQLREACCFNDGHCEDLTPDECKRKGGDPQGANTSCATVDCPQPTIEIDPFPSAVGLIELETVMGQAEAVALTGPVQMHVYFEGPEGKADDDDGNGKDEVEAEIVSLSLTGQSMMMGRVHVRLNPDVRSLGEIEEKANNTPGVLDVSPFADAGRYQCDSFFDVFVEIVMGDMMTMNTVVLYTQEPLQLRGVITHKPPRPCEAYESVEPIQLYDVETGRPTGIYITRLVVHPNPCEEPQACCLPDGTCVDETESDCLAKGGTPQGPGTDCSTVVCPAPGECDWNPNDPHKMHFPQLPDPGGWDVDVTADKVMADDWKCSKTGPVTDIHFWYSWFGDDVGIIDNIHVSIHADDRSGTYSKPGALLWERDFGPDQFTLRLYGTGQQGFMFPGPTPQLWPNDHLRIYQCNICNIPDPYTQQEGRIYWLDISIKIRDPLKTHIGWKTSLEQFEDDAVYDAGPLGGWAELIDPRTGESLDLAFVITGEEVPPPPTEIDRFPSALGQLELVTPMGQVELVGLTGPVEQHVHFEGPNMGDADDDDGNGLDEVDTEMVSMSLTGQSMMMGRVQVRLNPDVPSLGEIEEKVNNTPGILDLKPFVNDNVDNFRADSFFDVFVEIQMGDMMMMNTVVLHTQEPLQLRGVITHKPPRPCEVLESVQNVPLYDENGNLSGYVVSGLQLHPNPCEEPAQACCFADGTCQNLPPQQCIEAGGNPQGAGTDCTNVDCPVCDWNEGDPHKMHWPQLPDFTPSGLTYPLDTTTSLADDFLCTATGPIKDIHIWGGFQSDFLPFTGPGGVTFELSIYSNRPADADEPYSSPRWLLWSRTFRPGQYTVRKVYDGPQTFLQNHLYVEPSYEHSQTYQYNFCIEDRPFTQEEGNIYWLGVRVSNMRGRMFGWKTTSPALGWEDAAVLQVGGRWYPRGPGYMSEPLNFAFVITGEEGPAPPPQACCLPDGTCQNLTPAQCVAAGGVPQGPGTDCSMVDCLPAGECHWIPGDRHKMHWPQLPGDPDVEFAMSTLADDWQCSRSGPVDDMHFWVSWMKNQQQPINNLTIIIYSDIPDPDGTGPGYSTPGDILWSRNFGPDEFRIRNMPEAPQGWFDPSSGEWIQNDHTLWQQIDICQIPDPFPQEEGKIYWLGISFGDMPFVGWKASRSAQFNDDGVWWDRAGKKWIELRNPTTGESLDLAFVITGREEPLTEACCFNDGTCQNLPRQDCRRVGGTPQGPGTQCSAARQPCCLPDGSCQMLDPLCCDDLGGKPSPTGASACLGDADGDGTDDACEGLPSDEVEYGDAPEASIAYPSLCVVGAFPTCVNIGPAGWIQHANSRAYFGQTVDFENEGNAGKCPVFTPNTYDQDECFQDGDGGLINPPAYTIQGPIGLETVVPCVASQTGSLGQVCQTAVWGTDIDIQVVNNNANARRYVNVLADWNRNGKWGGSMTCASGIVANEHVLVNFAIPAGYNGPLSGLNPPNFNIGPYPGYVWFRFMISESLILTSTPDGSVYDWDGSGSFQDGETEDYLLHIIPVLKIYDCHWDEGDGHKMHWPQLPDLKPTGVDVDNFWVPLADDFLCTESGPIRDIHIWGSFAGDCLPPAGVGGMTFQFSIWTNIPADADSTMPWSRPGERKWTRIFEPCQYTVRRVDEEGPEDWYDPATGLYVPGDHFQVYQYNFCIDEEPFMVQEEGTIYWLEVKDITPDDAGATFGWKTTIAAPEDKDLRYMDDAVWRNEDPAVGPVGWLPLKYPKGHDYFGQTMDLAFVITGEKEPCGWKPGDPHKMHFPQLPDPQGWDLDVVADNISADDWRCSATGTVDDIHFWYSWLGDKVGTIDYIHVSIHSNVAADDPTNPYDYSVPGELLWVRDFGPDEFSLCYWGSGNQGFIMPGGDARPNDHDMIFQCDIVNIPDPFPQEKGKIYWLDLSIKIQDPLGTHIGWKTSQDHFEDDAVYYGGAVGWQEWIDPVTGDSLDLAFVITGKEEAGAHELGDAPDSSNSFPLTPMTAYPKGGPAGVQANYPTVFGAGSPPHGPIHLQPKAAVWLGPAVTLETEADIWPDEDAVNNIDPPNDQPDQDRADDGVQVPLVLPHCKQTTFDYGVQIVPGGPNLDWYVNVWFDWNRDGDWDDAPQCPSTAAVIVADEWAVQNKKLSGLAPGYYVFATPPFRCWHPTGDDDPDPIWMRITISEQAWDPIAGTVGYGGSGPANGYLYGETEDYYFVPGMPERDWGDAPDSALAPGYPTLASSNGANHIIGGPWLGNAGDTPDPEPDGQPHLNALGDDLDTGAGNPGPNHDDEDGVFVPPLIRGQTVYATIQVNGGGGTVQVWVDFDGSNSWEAAEQVFNAFRGAGFHAIPIPVPNAAVLGQTFARLRISVNGGLGPDGPAPDGEVEDHEVWINDPPPNTKWLNLPDLTPFGIDIRADDLRILADDFECTSYSRVTDVHLWCSWKDDIKGEIKNIHLSIHADDPAGPAGDDPENKHSQPGRDPLWTGDFGPGEFNEELYYVVRYPKEYWWDPAKNELIRPGDSEVWQVNIDINPDEAFLQKGSPDNPIIYWLDVRFETENGEIGWKTRQWPQHFMDDAVWDRGSELPRIWKELRYPVGHPYHGLERDSIDMAFVITSTEEGPAPKPAIKHLKWSQPPIEIDPRSKTPLYCGWDQYSYATTQPNIAHPVHWSMVADDFRCLGSMPITSVHWWGSYKNQIEGWQESNPPAIKPSSWRIGFWSNVVWSSIPPNPETDYSHPGKLLWQIAVPAEKVHEERVGIDRFPNKPSDTCFQYYVDLEPKQYFWQEKFIPNTRDNVFWISIVAVYDHPAGNIPFTWGWKTRPAHWMDDAVRFMYGDPVEVGLELPAAAFSPIEGELECAGAIVKRSFDMAFELDTDPTYIKWEQGYTGIRDWRHYADEESLAFERTVLEVVTKYRQDPDLSATGVDVDATLSLARPQTLADDFECTTTGPLTDIHIWGSWYNDEPPGGDPCNVIFRLSIHRDIPANSDTIPGYSMPGDQLWEGVFQPGQFTVERVSTNVPEGYYNACGPLPVVPPTNYVPQNHFKVFKYNFYIDVDEAFPQEGTPDKPVVYWLVVQAQPILIGSITDARFGWKTSLEHWNDDAVWRTNIMPISRPWEELRYPDGHPYNPDSIDLAFEITTETEEKELKVRRLVADDWLCKRETPVTAAVWWGSYIGYSYEACACPVTAPPVKPDYFLLSIWSDVRPTNEVPYSHPGEKIWHYKAYDYDEVLVGYDKHPHEAPKEAVFRYSVRLPQDKWFCQDGVDQIYWFSVMAVYQEGADLPYPWGWTNHKCHECKAWEPPGLAEVTHFKFDETGGIIASDSSGNDNHGTLMGDPTWKPCCGAVCGALDLDGDGDYVKTADTTTGLDFAPNSFSVSVWINARDVTDGWRTILEYDRDGSNQNRFGVWLSSEGRFHFRVGLDTMDSVQKLDPDKWYLLTATYNATDKKMSLYIDGSFDSSEAQSGGFGSAKATKLTIGVRGSEDAEYFNGLIDDLRIYDYVLSAEQIKALAGMKRNDDAVAGNVDTSGAAPVWSWKELYDQTDMSEDMSFILFTDCFPCTYSTYPDWLALGKPRCWCAPQAGTGYQCDGDADGGTETFFKYRIYGNDINLVLANWKKKVGDPLLDPCADIDHKSETFFKYRVYGKDLATVVTNWKKKDRDEPYDPTVQLPGDCPRPE